jgi:hypothetical protein
VTMAGAAAVFKGAEPLPEASLELALITISEGAMLRAGVMNWREMSKQADTAWWTCRVLNFWVDARISLFWIVKCSADVAGQSSGCVRSLRGLDPSGDMTVPQAVHLPFFLPCLSHDDSTS